MAEPIRLYHFTSRQHAERILQTGTIVPRPQPPAFYAKTPAPCIWLTTLAEPDEWQVGLTSDSLPYSRMGARFTIDSFTAHFLTWKQYADRFGLTRKMRHDLTMGGALDTSLQRISLTPLSVKRADVLWLNRPPTCGLPTPAWVESALAGMR